MLKPCSDVLNQTRNPLDEALHFVRDVVVEARDEIRDFGGELLHEVVDAARHEVGLVQEVAELQFEGLTELFEALPHLFWVSDDIQVGARDFGDGGFEVGCKARPGGGFLGGHIRHGEELDFVEKRSSDITIWVVP